MINVKSMLIKFLVFLVLSVLCVRFWDSSMSMLEAFTFCILISFAFAALCQKIEDEV